MTMLYECMAMTGQRRHAIQNDNPAIVAGAIEKVIQSVESRVPLTV
jgi:hypothetical protein